ncbi:B3/B4 domain-containing protein [Micromonospora aurantiaca (nom. illeg.)]|uniref:B3/B4 domain-containing protein n=1 Tax=Micromonospora aurantiaca (nom. illeg.) TaxID=47850 RepID=UPI003F4A3079
MGCPPTRYRCAAESLLRRLRRDGDLPRLHPLVDLGNALSVRCAVPVAVLDLARIGDDLTVRPADGTESYLGLGGDSEQPAPGEVIFADQGGNAHARRWCHRHERHVSGTGRHHRGAGGGRGDARGGGADRAPDAGRPGGGVGRAVARAVTDGAAHR